jgi:hypothetical protein
VNLTATYFCAVGSSISGRETLTTSMESPKIHCSNLAEKIRSDRSSVSHGDPICRFTVRIGGW